MDSQQLIHNFFKTNEDKQFSVIMYKNGHILNKFFSSATKSSSTSYQFIDGWSQYLYIHEEILLYHEDKFLYTKYIDEDKTIFTSIIVQP